MDKIILILLFFIAECRTLQENQYQPQLRFRRNEFNNFNERLHMNDGPSEDEDEEQESKPDIKATILTTGLVVDTTEGTTVNLPCRVPTGIREYLLAPFVIKNMLFFNIFILIS